MGRDRRRRRGADGRPSRMPGQRSSGHQGHGGTPGLLDELRGESMVPAEVTADGVPVCLRVLDDLASSALHTAEWRGSDPVRWTAGDGCKHGCGRCAGSSATAPRSRSATLLHPGTLVRTELPLRSPRAGTGTGEGRTRSTHSLRVSVRPPAIDQRDNASCDALVDRACSVEAARRTGCHLSG